MSCHGDSAPTSISLRLYAPNRHQRSSSQYRPMLNVPAVKTEIDRRAFAYAVPSVWKHLSVVIQRPESNTPLSSTTIRPPNIYARSVNTCTNCDGYRNSMLNMLKMTACGPPTMLSAVFSHLNAHLGPSIHDVHTDGAGASQKRMAVGTGWAR